MARENQIREILEACKLSIDNPQFFSRIFSLLAKRVKFGHSEKKDTIHRVVAEEYDELSRRLDRSVLQESCSVRNVLRTRQLALLLIDNQGDVRVSLIPELITLFKAHLYSLGPNRQHDSKRQEHILKVLQLLHDNKDFVRILKKIGKPFSHKHADQIIRDTLQLPLKVAITDAHARRAALAAWMCYLRQNVGSCFATAPAEIIHDEQPEKFLADIDELLSTGRLKRVFSGIEYVAPMSSSWGSGELKKSIAMQRNELGWSPEIWYSPGLLAAFGEAGLFAAHETIKHKISKIREWVLQFLEEKKLTWQVISSEKIIRYVLLKEMQLTEKDLQDYENRSHGMLQTSLLMHVSSAAKGSWGIGEACAKFHQQYYASKNAFKALSDNALLKSWEFTLASFSETKSEFTSWNLYASLGLGPEDSGGIGRCIYDILKKKLDECNRKVHEIQYEYEQVHAQMQMLEGRLRGASTEHELQWVRVEYQARRNEFLTLQEIRDSNQRQAHRYANLFELLVDSYLGLFPGYFQEVYDADMQDVVGGLFDDSPAGFRLLYKHGRSNTSQWTAIHNHNEFIDSLASFFVATEPHIVVDLALKDIEHEFSEIVTAVINQVKTKEFLETAFYRMAMAHKTPIVRDPLDNLDKVEKKPWAYTSGGTMNTLLSCYYRRDDKPHEVSRWVENETELLVFLIDVAKQLPPKLAEKYLNGSRQSLLMHSPTHAFLFKPFQGILKEAWENEAYTYTWVRDRFLLPAKEFINRIKLDEQMIQHLVGLLAEKVPYSHQHYFKKAFQHIYRTMNPWEFREHIVSTMEQDRGLNQRGSIVVSEDEIDSLLYVQLPLFHLNELRDRVERIFSRFAGIHPETVGYIMEIFDEIPMNPNGKEILGAQQLLNICKGLLCLASQSTSKGNNYHEQIIKAARESDCVLPLPIFFADTNWIKDEFGFIINPGTGRLELWRLDCIGAEGYPMSSWKQWLNGSRRDAFWGVYNGPQEYGQI